MGIPRRQKAIEGRHAYVDGIRYVMPIDSWNASAIMAVFPCDFERARALLPDGYVQPFRLWNHALLIVTVIDYRETDIGAYIEYSIAVACTHGQRPRIRFVPALFRKLFGTGQFVIDLPVSSEISVKGGKGIWGMPKHQANLDFVSGEKWISSQYDLDGRMVARLDIKRPSRYWLPLNTSAANYCQFRGMILRSFIHFRARSGIRLMQPGSARFLLGDHPRAEAIRSLLHGEEPLFAAHMPDLRGLLDDYFESWFVTPAERPEEPLGEGLEATYPLGFSQEWLEPPARDPSFDLDKD